MTDPELPLSPPVLEPCGPVPAEPAAPEPPAPAALELPAARMAKARAAVHVGIIPRSIEAAWRLAQYIAESEIVPKQYQKKPANVLVAIQFGAEVGLEPMQAIQGLAVINGIPRLYGDHLLAVVMRSPLYRKREEFFEVNGKPQKRVSAEELARDTTTAVCLCWRADQDKPTEGSFSVAQARTAGYMGKGPAPNKEGPWRTHPDRMLQMRARAFALRDCFPDVTRGLGLTAEEARDLPLEAEREPRTVRRISETEPTP